MDQLEDTPRILSSVRCHTCSFVWLETATFPLHLFGETLAGGLMVGEVTVEALDGRGGEDVFTWILIVWATRGVVIKFCKPSYEERRVLRASYWTVYRDLMIPRLLDEIREMRR